MKTTFRYFPAFILFLVIFVGCTQTNNYDNTVSILDYRNKDLPDVNLEAHKSGDVNVYRSILMGEGYSVVFYSDFTGELLSHNAFYGSDEYFGVKCTV